MEIIKRGQLPSETKAEWTCRNCKSEIRSKKSEGVYVSEQRDGDYIKVSCLVCSYENFIAAKLYK